MQAPSSQRKPPRNVRVERGIYFRETLDGPRWEFCYPNGNGGMGWETVRSLSAARKGRARMIAAVDRGEPVIRRNVKGAESLEAWYVAKAPKVRPRTRAYYRMALDAVLLPRFGRAKLSSIGPDEIASLIRDLEREGLHAIDPEKWPVYPLGKSSIENYLKPLSGTLKRALRKGLIPSDPFAALEKDDRPTPAEKVPEHEWTDEEVEALVAASVALAAKPESRYDYSLLLRVAVTLGLRLGEVLGLQWLDFEKDGYLCVRRQWLRAEKVDGVMLPARYGPPKTEAGERRIPLPDDLRDMLIEHRLRSRFSGDEDPIFASRVGGPLGHRNTTRRGWEPARKLAGLPESLTFHDLRGAAASQLIDAGLDVVTVAEIIGHGDRGATLLKHYAGRFNKERKDDAIRAALSAKPVQSSHPSPPVDMEAEEASKVAQLRALSTGGD